MRGSIGQILVQRGVVDAAGLADALARQSGRHPLASELYTLGYASERVLCAALVAQTGWPAVVLDESTIRLDVLEHVTPEWARVCNALVIFEDTTSLVIAAARPEEAIAPARELAEARGKHVELLVALDVTLARTIRVAFRRWKQGAPYLAGPEVERAVPGLAIVYPDGGEDAHRQAQRALAEDAARDIERADELPPDDGSPVTLTTSDWNLASETITRAHEPFDAAAEERTLELVAELDGAAAVVAPHGRTRALVVDADAAGRTQMVGELERLGCECHAVSSGAQALDLMSRLAFDLVFADVATPAPGGLQLCLAIKRSRRAARCKVVVTTSVVDSGQVPDEALQRHEVDGYLEKPLDARRLHRLVRDLSSEERDHEALLADALARYHGGDIDGAIERVRGALTTDPASSRLHFTLANLLQRASRWAEAVDEYESVVELQPAYFPALTRLAYLYFRQGLHARAVETWRRALPVCEDPELRRNIELFMRKLVADMARSEAG